MIVSINNYLNYVKPSQAMILEVTVGNGYEFVLPAYGINNLNIDWGDTNQDSAVTVVNPSHTYTTAGTYQIKVSGSMDSFGFGTTTTSRNNVDKVIALGNLGLINIQYGFKQCVNMTEFTVGDSDLSGVTSLKGLLQYCSALNTVSMDSFVTSSTSDISYMFDGCLALSSIPVSSWDTSNVTTMKFIFQKTGLTVLDVSNFNFSSIVGDGITYLFRFCYTLSTVTVPSSVPSNVTNISGLFYDTHALTTITGVETWDTSNILNFTSVFYRNYTLTGMDLSSWDVSTATTLFVTFFECFALDVSFAESWNPSSATSFYGLFYGTNTTSLDLSTWVCPNLTVMTEMFRDSGIQTIDLSGINNSNNVNASQLFDGCVDLTSVDISGINSMYYVDSMFQDCTSITSIDMTGTTTVDVGINSMFKGCTSLVSVTLGSIVGLISVQDMFDGCTSLTTVNNISGLDTSAVTTMSNVFRNCSSLTTIDLSSWNMGSLNNTSGFMEGVTLSIPSYEGILTGWETTLGTDTETLHFGSSKYSSPAAIAAKASIEADGWIIIDGGGVLAGDGKYTAGYGTLAQPYIISTPTDVQTLSDLVYSGDWDAGIHYEQINNIDISASTGWNTGLGMKPIGDVVGFFGTYDGAGYNISNVFMDRTNDVGFFGAMAGTATDLHLLNVNITGTQRTGGLVGHCAGAALTDCSVTGVVTGDIVVGGFMAYNSAVLGSSATVSRCKSDCTVVSTGVAVDYNTGGFVGSLDTNYITMTECEAHGTVAGAGDVGGFVGMVNSGGSEVGLGLSDCYTDAEVLAGDSVGGFVGELFSYGNLLFDYCYTSSVIATGATHTGGFTGDNYAAGNPPNATCYFDSDVAGTTSTDCNATAKTTVQMQTEATYVGWDFTTIWDINPSEYPYLINI